LALKNCAGLSRRAGCLSETANSLYGLPAMTAGFQQVGHHRDVARGFVDAFLDRAHAVADVEADVPDQADHLGQALQVRPARFGQQEEQVDVRAGEELARP
jgi:hypothetical protein